MLRTQLYANPEGIFLHNAILDACRSFPNRIAIVDSSCTPHRRITYAEYGEMLEALARGFVAAGIRPGEVIAIWLANSWEFAVAYHAATLAGAIPTLLNPSYREREVRFQLENSGAALLIADGSTLKDVNLAGLPNLRRAYFTRTPAAGAEPFANLLQKQAAVLPAPDKSSQDTLAALPYSSGTTGLPKGVMLSHYNLVANIYQLVGPNAAPITGEDCMLCFLPLYHIYGLTVGLNTMLLLGGTLVLMPRFQTQPLFALMVDESVTVMPTVPPVLNALSHSAAAGEFPKKHQLHWVKSGAAPLAPELARRFTELTGVIVNQGYGMTEASPVTHVGHCVGTMNRPWTIGQPLVATECRILDDAGDEVGADAPGELVMRGPQFMRGYWKEPQATAAVLRDGWYWSGDVAVKSDDNFFQIVDRRKEMIKYKGFPIAPAEVEAVLMEHPAVRDCGVAGRPDLSAGELPCAFIVLRDGQIASPALEQELGGWVAERLTGYKQPREFHFLDSIPRTPSGKILRRELRNRFA